MLSKLCSWIHKDFPEKSENISKTYNVVTLDIPKQKRPHTIGKTLWSQIGKKKRVNVLNNSENIVEMERKWLGSPAAYGINIDYSIKIFTYL